MLYITYIVKTTSTSPEVSDKEIADSLIRPKTRKYIIFVCYIFTIEVFVAIHMHFAMLYI